MSAQDAIFHAAVKVAAAPMHPIEGTGMVFIKMKAGDWTLLQSVVTWAVSERLQQGRGEGVR